MACSHTSTPSFCHLMATAKKQGSCHRGQPPILFPVANRALSTPVLSTPEGYRYCDNLTGCFPVKANSPKGPYFTPLTTNTPPAGPGGSTIRDPAPERGRRAPAGGESCLIQNLWAFWKIKPVCYRKSGNMCPKFKKKS